MSEKESRTERATPKREGKLRDEGKFARSADFTAAVSLMIFCIALGSLSPGIAHDLEVYTRRTLSFQDLGNPGQAVSSMITTLGSALLPIMIVCMLAAIAIGTIQTKGFFKLSMVAPKFQKFMDPIGNIRRMIPGTVFFVELGKNLLKMVLVGGVIFTVIFNYLPEFKQLPSMNAMTAAALVLEVAGDVALYGSIAFAVIAVIDYWYNKRKFADDSKMTKEDVKDEHKQAEGDPKVKAKLRQKAREFAGRRAIKDTAAATVVVTNPTHISIALRYVQGQDFAPIVLAKGVDAVALKMRDVARHKQIPIVENKPLARTMYADVEVGHPIPFELYSAVAEIIAHVMRIKGALAA